MTATNLPALAGDDGADVELFQPVSIFDEQRFTSVARVAQVMSRATLIPDALKSRDGEVEETYGNCFMVANIAYGWKMDPFMVATAISIVYGKPVIEGKLVRAVLDKFLGFLPHYRFNTQSDPDAATEVWVSDIPFVGAQGEEVDDNDPDARDARGAKITHGTFEKWHTKNKSGGINDNWAKDRAKMFRERGAREWARQWRPGLMLGVYTPDEFDEAEMTARSNRATDITPAATDGFNPLTGTRRNTAEPAAAAASSPEKSTAAKPEATSDGKAAATPSTTTSPTVAAGDAGGGAEPNRLSAEEFHAYFDAIVRMTSAESVAKADKAHWGANRPPVHPDDKQLCKDIWSNVQEYVKNPSQLPIDVLKSNVAGWVAMVTGGAK